MPCKKVKNRTFSEVSRMPSETSVKYGYFQPGLNKTRGCLTTLDADLIY